MTAHRPTFARLAVTAALALGLVAAGATTALAADTATAAAPTDRSATLCAGRTSSGPGWRRRSIGSRAMPTSRARSRGCEPGASARRPPATPTSPRPSRPGPTAARRAAPEIEDVLDRLASASAEHCDATS